MGFFSKWFGRNRSKETEAFEPADAERLPFKTNNFFFTNAPGHWGKFSNEFLKSNNDFVKGWEANQSNSMLQKRSFMVNSLLLMGKINDVFLQMAGDKVSMGYGDGFIDADVAYATSCCVEKLFSKGIFSLNGIAVDNYERYGVVLFDSPTTMAYFEELRAYFIEEGFKDLIYFAVYNPLEVSDNGKKLVFEDFNKACFKFNAEAQFTAGRKYDRYALWWAANPDDDFLKSSVKADMGISIDILDFHESYALGILSYAFGLKEDNSRTRLPDEDLVNMEGPEGVQIVLSLSQQKGIIFLFPALPQFARYRDNFIKTYVNFCYGIRAQILEHDMPKDEFGQSSVMEWYNHLLAEVEANQGNVQAVCVYAKQKWYNINLN